MLPQLQVLTQIPIMNHDCHMCMKWAPFPSALPQLLEVLTSGFSSNLIAELESGFNLCELFFEILVLFCLQKGTSSKHPVMTAGENATLI